MRTTTEQRARQASAREQHCAKCKFGGTFCAYVEICHQAFVRGYIKGVADRPKQTSVASLSVQSQQFDQTVWQTETGFTSAQYNAWLKGAVDSLENIYQQIENTDHVDNADLYILGDVINMLSVIKIVKNSKLHD